MLVTPQPATLKSSPLKKNRKCLFLEWFFNETKFKFLKKVWDNFCIFMGGFKN